MVFIKLHFYQSVLHWNLYEEKISLRGIQTVDPYPLYQRLKQLSLHHESVLVLDHPI